MSDFEEGDVVYLKSGGPKMTITEIRDVWNSCCEWFVQHDELKRGSFKNSTLTKINPRMSNRPNSGSSLNSGGMPTFNL
ncbi:MULTISPECIES: YodC family protein [Acinetobacter]|uniref:YodC family protein n=1 Tax=Acinetobacter TaxID=469 RepID=UPI002005FE2B|nr:DUF2158 domain-containing protein [Acinetobacter radioresistens]MCK4082098.1 DUF2158 domain-containing protein [Acinetobacter radioresistens]